MTGLLNREQGTKTFLMEWLDLLFERKKKLVPLFLQFIWHKEAYQLTYYSPFKCCSVLSYNLGRSSANHRGLCNNPFPTRLVFSCPSWAGIVNFCPFLNIAFPRLLLSILSSSSSLLLLCPVGSSWLNQKSLRRDRTSSETDSIKFKISSKTSRGKKDCTKRHHHRHHKRQPGVQQFSIQVVTG